MPGMFNGLETRAIITGNMVSDLLYASALNAAVDKRTAQVRVHEVEAALLRSALMCRLMIVLSIDFFVKR